MTSAPEPDLSRAEVLRRAQFWVDRRVHYMSLNASPDDAVWPSAAADPDGRLYRTDCSGYVAMAWRAPAQPDTNAFGELGDEISRDELLPGDALVWLGVGGYGAQGGHALLFAGWNDPQHRTYLAYELASGRYAALHDVPYPYFREGSRYVPWRCRYVTPR